MYKTAIKIPMSQEHFKSYVEALHIENEWKPNFVVLHNTSEPTLTEWHLHSGAERMANLENYYKNELNWSAGPHLFIADDFIWLFTPLTTPGVHSPSWNSLSIGVEMVGEFNYENFDSGKGLKVQENAVFALAVLHKKYNLDSSSLRFHKEDPKTTHKECPGKLVNKSQIITKVHNKILELYP